MRSKKYLKCDRSKPIVLPDHKLKLPATYEMECLNMLDRLTEALLFNKNFFYQNTKILDDLKKTQLLVRELSQQHVRL